MEYAAPILVQVGIMFLLMLIGYGLFKIKKITPEGRKQLSELVLTIVCPALILMVYQTEHKPEYTTGLIWAFVLSAVSMAAGIIFSKSVISKKFADYTIDRFSVAYSNCAFIGIPLINGVFGEEGVLYVTAYITLFNLLVWSHGVMMMKNELSLSGLVKALRSPTIIAVFIGIITYIAQIRIPKIPAEAINYIASLNTPLAMLIAGATMAESNLAGAIRKPSVLFSCFLKLLALPVLVMLIFKLFPVPSSTVYTTIIIATACPTATIGTLFALRYGKNAVYASEVFALSTLLSGITIPVIVLLSMYMYGI
ncbi:MAG: AEC family transporter [Clostridia bacterium]|nr:AEC family transporter [Clostridia bacterium]